MKIAGHDIGVCSWSLKPRSTQELITLARELGLLHVQLDVSPLIQLDDKRKHQEFALLKNSGVSIIAAMISFPGEDYSTIAAIRKSGGYLPDDQWDLRKRLTQQAAQLTSELGAKMLSTHIGFIPPSSDPKYAVMVERVREIAQLLAANNLTLVMETGQETATELLQFINDLTVRNIQVSFDAANMILYGAGDPIDAVAVLGRHVALVHIKDAVMSEKPGTDWGTEVPFGTGQVPPREFLNSLHAVTYRGPLLIERDSGESRIPDIKTALATLKTASA